MRLPPLTYDDLQVGMKIRSQGITVTETHIVQFAELTGDYNPLHVNEEFARQTIFQGRVAHGLLTISLAVGLLTPLFAGTIIALLEMNIKLQKPVRIGDTIYTESEVIEKKDSDKYNGGVITFKQEVKNQTGETVAEIIIKVLMSRGMATKENVLKTTQRA